MPPELARAIQAVTPGSFGHLEVFSRGRIGTRVTKASKRVRCLEAPIPSFRHASARSSRRCAGGMSNKQIARELGISDMTVKTHAQNIFGKLGISAEFA